MATGNLNLTPIPYSTPLPYNYDELAQIQKPAPIKGSESAINASGQGNADGSAGMKAHTAANPPSRTAGVLDGANFAMAASSEDAGSQVGTQISVYA
jgi:hypothetical protein